MHVLVMVAKKENIYLEVGANIYHGVTKVVANTSGKVIDKTVGYFWKHGQTHKMTEIHLLLVFAHVVPDQTRYITSCIFPKILG